MVFAADFAAAGFEGRGGVSFQTEGGYFPQVMVPPASRVDIALPMRLLTSPIEVPAGGSSGASSVNYVFLYMVDAGRAGQLGSRGQVLRIDTLTATYDTTLEFQVQ